MSTLGYPNTFHPRVHRRRSGLYVSASGGVSIPVISAPSDIANLRAAWAFNDTAKITDAGAGVVSAVTGSYGTSVTASQGTSGSRHTTETRKLNSINLLDFDGSAYHLGAGYDPNPGGTSARTMAGVVMIDTIGGGGLAPIFGTDDGSDGGLELFVLESGRLMRMDNCNASQIGTSNPATPAFGTAFFFAASRTNNGAYKMWVYTTAGGELTNSGTDGTHNWSGTHTVRLGMRARGTNYFFNGIIAELLDYDRFLTDTQVRSLRNFCVNKWAI